MAASVVSRGVLLRTWNVFHGNTVPRGRVNLLEQAVRLAASGDPAVVCLQELPLWSLECLDDWSGMPAVGAVARRSLLPRRLARRLTELDPVRFRSGFTGQGNAVLVDPALHVIDSSSIVLNPIGFRSRLDVPLASRLAWAKERRVCQSVRLGLPDGRTMTVANLHATSYRRDPRLADAEVLRAAVFLDAVAAPEDVAVLAGDFNLRVGAARALAEVVSWGFSAPGQGIDHMLVRGAAAGPQRRWPEERRRIDGALVSDHAPVELTIE
jgi:endonuclease/exonuclease/phosphatase family metal-dependent hydrolase